MLTNADGVFILVKCKMILQRELFSATITHLAGLSKDEDFEKVCQKFHVQGNEKCSQSNKY